MPDRAKMVIFKAVRSGILNTGSSHEDNDFCFHLDVFHAGVGYQWGQCRCDLPAIQNNRTRTVEWHCSSCPGNVCLSSGVSRERATCARQCKDATTPEQAAN